MCPLVAPSGTPFVPMLSEAELLNIRKAHLKKVKRRLKARLKTSKMPLSRQDANTYRCIYGIPIEGDWDPPTSKRKPGTPVVTVKRPRKLKESKEDPRQGNLLSTK